MELQSLAGELDERLSECTTVALAYDAGVIVHMGGLTIALHFVTPPQKLDASPFAIDFQFLNIWLLALFAVTMAVVCFGLHPYETASAAPRSLAFLGGKGFQQILAGGTNDALVHAFDHLAPTVAGLEEVRLRGGIQSGVGDAIRLRNLTGIRDRSGGVASDREQAGSMGERRETTIRDDQQQPTLSGSMDAALIKAARQPQRRSLLL